MADAQQVDLSYGTFMVLRKPLFSWLRWGGFVLALIEVISEAQTAPGTHHGKLDLLFWTKVVGAVIYGIIFIQNVPLKVDLEPHHERLLLIQTLLGAVLSLDLTNLSAFCIPFCVPMNRRLRWFGAALAANFLGWMVRMTIYSSQAHPFWVEIAHSPARLLVALVILGGNYIWYGFAFFGACLLFELARRQQQLSVANQELVDLQAEIKEAAKFEERFRLSRELHDSAGHYLTSLGIQLQIAQHHAATAALPAISRAQLITRVLLAEIRESVSAWREDDFGDLAGALKRLLREIVGLDTHFEGKGDLTLVPRSLAHDIYRCAQEAVTNVLRHSGAQNLWMTLACQDGKVVLSIIDDGRGCVKFSRGNGLNGMQSRVNEMGGELTFPAPQQTGFAVSVSIPFEEGKTL
ncbi:MAG: sensor histidine kinase [Edaphobacter sp.]